MLPDVPPLPWPYRLLNRVGSALGAERLDSFRFDSERLLDAAAEEAGLADFGDGWFREGYERFLESLESDAALSPIGRKGIRGMVVTLLVNRLLHVQARKEAPAHFETPLRGPVIILGMPRSGTTFLHRLLSIDPRLRALPMWKLFRPVRREPPNEVRQVLERALAMRRRLTPDLDRKHVSRADSPEECIWLLNSTFVSHGLWVVAPVYRYLDWLAGHDRIRAYQEYGELLRYLQAEEPDRRLLLKAPNHSGSIDALLNAVPDARLIQLHRDPVEVCSSLNSLFYSVYSAVVNRLDVPRMARANLDLLANEMARNLDARRRRPAGFIDIAYGNLVNNPIEAVRGVYRQLGLDWTEQVEAGLSRHLAQNPRHRHGVHRHSLADFGLDAREVEARFLPYREESRRLFLTGGTWEHKERG